LHGFIRRKRGQAKNKKLFIKIVSIAFLLCAPLCPFVAKNRR
jgi:hypothetical protein